MAQDESVISVLFFLNVCLYIQFQSQQGPFKKFPDTFIHLKQTGFCQTTTHTTPSKGIWGKPSTSQPVLLQNLPLLLFMNIYVTGAAIYLSLSMFYNRCCCVFVFSSFSRPLWPELLQADGQSYCRVVLSPF